MAFLIKWIARSDTHSCLLNNHSQPPVRDSEFEGLSNGLPRFSFGFAAPGNQGKNFIVFHSAPQHGAFAR
jgi:hypothetical protein